MPINFTFTLAQVPSDRPSLLFASELLSVENKEITGETVRVLETPWREIFRELESSPDSMFEFARNPRVFEEFIAGAYSRAGFHVTLTPRSGDKGRDVIAEKPGFCGIRILDQCKAFSKGRKVGLDDVRAMFGVLNFDRNASKAVISTTTEFAPGVLTAEEIQACVPYRLELRDGLQIMEWLRKQA